MGHVFLLAFDSEGAYQLGKQLRILGHRVTQTPPKAPDFLDLLKQQRIPPDVFVGDCGQRPNLVRESCAYIRGMKAYATTPFLLLNVRPEEQAAAVAKVPGAETVAGDKALEHVKVLLAKPAA